MIDIVKKYEINKLLLLFEINPDSESESNSDRTNSEEDLTFVEIKNVPNRRNRGGEGAHNQLQHQRNVSLHCNEVRPSSSSSVMEESWFVTPPSCFTSLPITLETSPLENLLIEHPRYKRGIIN